MNFGPYDSKSLRRIAIATEKIAGGNEVSIEDLTRDLRENPHVNLSPRHASKIAQMLMQHYVIRTKKNEIEVRDDL